MNTPTIARRRSRRRTGVTALALVLAAAIVFGVRSFDKDTTPSPGDALWHIILVCTVDADEANTPVRIAPPFDTPQVQLVSQTVALSGLRLRRTAGSRADRNLVLIADEPGQQRARIVFEVHQRALPWRRAPVIARSLPTKLRERFLRPEPGIQSDAVAVQELAQTLGSTRPATTPLAEHLVVQTTERITLAHGTALSQDASGALRTGRSTALGRARVAIALLRASLVPARLVSGVVLDETRTRQPHLWLEAFHDGGWQAYDPEYGYMSELPTSYVPMHRGGEFVAWSESGASVQTLLAIERQFIALKRAPESGTEWLSVFEFARLPQSARATIALLLMLPLGALVTAFARLVLGVKTYGIFTPALLALAAQFVDFATASAIVAVIAIFGFLGLSALPRTLSRTPRLAVVFTLVALSMGAGVALLLHLGRSAENVVVLLPVVVLTGLVDNFYAVTEKYGLRIALTRLVWTALAAIVCYFIFAREEIGLWLLHHPELHLATMGAIVWMGAYRSNKLARKKHLEQLRKADSVREYVPRHPRLSEELIAERGREAKQE